MVLRGRVDLDDPDRMIVHAATGIPILSSGALEPGETISVSLPHVDQSGFIGSDSEPIIGWGYIITVAAMWADGTAQTIIKHVQPLVGHVTINLALVGNGEFTPPVTGPTLYISKVADLTGPEVDAEELADTLSPFLDGSGAALTEHTAATTDVHGIADTSVLATDADVAAAVSGLATAASVTAEAATRAAADTTLSTAIDTKANSSALTSEASTRAAADATLTTAVAGKADTVHTHAIADTTGLQTALDSKAAVAHTHAIANVTGLQGALDGKATAAQGALADTAVQPEDMAQAFDDFVGGAPGTLDTIIEIATAIEDNADTVGALTAVVGSKASSADLTTEATARAAADTALDDRLDTIEGDYATGTALAGHASDTTGIHGIADTSLLETTTGAQTKANAAQTAAEASAAAALTTHTADTANVHGIADTTLLETTAGAQSKADAAQAAAIQRANHTGTQSSSTITDFHEAVGDAVAALLASGTQISLSYNDAGDSLTVSATGADAEAMRDTLGAALVGVGNISVTVNDGADTITISTTATVNDTDANLKARANHTGTQTASTISDFSTAVDARAARNTLGGAEAKAVASATTGSTTLDCAAASVFTVTPTGNITAVVLSNPPASGTACTITFIVNQGATPRTIATPAGGVFIGAATPTQVANKTCIFTYLTVDGGTTWYCSAAVQV